MHCAADTVSVIVSLMGTTHTQKNKTKVLHAFEVSLIGALSGVQWSNPPRSSSAATKQGRRDDFV